MKGPGRYFIALLAGTWLIWSAAHADVVVLTSGEQFNSDKVWEEKGKIRFNMNGLVVSVIKSDVASIVRDDASAGERELPAIEARPAPQDRVQPPPVPQPSTTKQIEESAPAPRSFPPPDPPDPQKPQQTAKIKGIGFSGIFWQMRPTDLPGLSKIETEDAYGGIDQYWQPDASLSLGGALLDGLVFGFWQDRLYTIMMWVDGKPGYRRLKQAVFQRYGPGEASKTQPDRFVWVKDRTTDRLLEFDTERNIGIFWMRSRDLDAHIKQQYPATQPG